MILGKTGQMMSNMLDNKLREDLERLKKIRAHRYEEYLCILISIALLVERCFIKMFLF